MSATAAADSDLLALLAEQAGARASGVLTATRGKHRRLFCFERGMLVYAASNLIEEQFGEALVEQQLLTEDALQAAAAAAEAAGTKLGSFLRESGALEERSLEQAMERYARQLLASCFDEWDGGAYDFAPGRPNLAGEPTCRVSTAGTVLNRLAEAGMSPAALRGKLGPPGTKPAVERRRLPVLGEPAADPLTDYLLERCDGSHDLDALVRDSPAPEAETLARLRGLALLGVIACSSPGDSAAQEDAAFRAECLSRLRDAAHANHYAILGIELNAGPDAIRHAYYELARRLHPDRFRAGSLQDLVEQMEQYFARVTEAYNTLSDTDRRAEYDRQQQERSTSPAAAPERDPSFLARQNFARAKVLIGKKRLQDAVRFLENAVQQDEGQASYHLELGRLLILNPRRRDDSERHIRRALELDPTLTDAHVALAQLLERLGRTDAAASELEQALRWNPDHTGAQAALARLKQGEGAPSGRRLRSLWKGSKR